MWEREIDTELEKTQKNSITKYAQYSVQCVVRVLFKHYIQVLTRTDRSTAYFKALYEPPTLTPKTYPLDIFHTYSGMRAGSTHPVLRTGSAHLVLHAPDPA